MNYEIFINPDALQDISKAKEWYESESYGLGDEFVNEVDQTIRSLQNPIVDHKAVFKDHRRVLMDKFPYSIYYRRDVNNRIVRIIAVQHEKRSPDIVMRRFP